MAMPGLPPPDTPPTLSSLADKAVIQHETHIARAAMSAFGTEGIREHIRAHRAAPNFGEDVLFPRLAEGLGVTLDTFMNYFDTLTDHYCQTITVQDDYRRIPPFFRCSKRFLHKFIETDPIRFEWISTSYKNDKELAKLGVAFHIDTWHQLSDELQHDFDFAQECILLNSLVLYYVDASFFDERERILALLSEKLGLFYNIPERLKVDPEFIAIALEGHPDCIEEVPFHTYETRHHVLAHYFGSDYANIPLLKQLSKLKSSALFRKILMEWSKEKIDITPCAKYPAHIQLPVFILIMNDVDEEHIAAFVEETSSLRKEIRNHEKRLHSGLIQFAFGVANDPEIANRLSQLKHDDTDLIERYCHLIYTASLIEGLSPSAFGSKCAAKACKQLEEEMIEHFKDMIPGLDAAGIHKITTKRVGIHLLNYFHMYHDDDDLKPVILRFINSIIKGTFLTERFTRGDNPHLEALHEYDDDLFNRWAGLHGTTFADSDVVVTDSWEDLFLSGTEIESCQRVTEKTDENNALMGTVMDGRSHMLVIQENDVLRSRALLRIFFKENGDPALLLEETYTNTFTNDDRDELARIAKRIGDELGLDVHGDAYPVDDTTDEVSLEMFRGCAPYYWSDACGGFTDGNDSAVVQLLA